MARLRSENGCPWDREQTPEKLSRHLLEEAYEAVEAIDEGDWSHLEEELGDLLLQVVFQARIAEEEGRFDLSGVVKGIIRKLIRRHPHIFAQAQATTPGEVARNWERIKQDEKGGCSFMEAPAGLPAMMAALKVQNRAARDGFDWPDSEGVFIKLQEEIREVRESLGGTHLEVESEIGDLLFTVVNLARHLGVDPEKALRVACREFAGRYRAMEEAASRKGKEFALLHPDEKERLWEWAKTPGTGGAQDERDIGSFCKGNT